MNAAVTDKKIFTFKEVVWLVSVLLAVASTFIVTQIQVNNNRDAIVKMQTTLESNNLELLNYKLEQLNIKQDEFINSFNDFLDDYYKR